MHDGERTALAVINHSLTPEPCALEPRRSHDEQISLIFSRRYDGAPLLQERIHLAAHAESAGEIDAGLDREADTGNEATLLARLEVVEMRARAVKLVRVDRVTGAVNELLAVAA